MNTINQPHTYIVYCLIAIRAELLVSCLPRDTTCSSVENPPDASILVPLRHLLISCLSASPTIPVMHMFPPAQPSRDPVDQQEIPISLYSTQHFVLTLEDHGRTQLDYLSEILDYENNGSSVVLFSGTVGAANVHDQLIVQANCLTQNVPLSNKFLNSLVPHPNGRG